MMTIAVKKVFSSTYIGPIFAILALSIFLSLASPYFLNVTNFINIGNQIAINVIIATGMTMVICSGGIDLSVGSNVALAGVMVALYFSTAGSGFFSVLLGIILGIVVGMLVGFMNGMVISLLRVPPFITTLGTMGVVRGLALVFSGGRPLMGMPDNFLSVFSGFVFGIPKPVIVAILIALLGAFLLNKTTLGRYAQAMGGNERCVRISGIHAKKYKIILYTLEGALAAISGLALTSMMATAEPIAGNWYELEAIAVVVMGGTSLQGGKGTILGTVLGALLLGITRNGLNLMHVPANYHQLLVGVIILLAVVAGSFKRAS